MTLDAVFVRDGDRYRPTELARGPWNPGALHGGAPAALIVRAVEQCTSAPELRPARITCEFVRPVPLDALSVQAEVVRPGRRVVLVDASISDGSGTEVVRARALCVRPSELGDVPTPGTPFPGPSEGRPTDFPHTAPMFATDAMEIRFVAGAFREIGSATAWFRLRHPLVAGEPTSPLALLAAAGDFGNGIASVLSWEDHIFINPDLTLYFEREPQGEWVALQSEMRVSPGGVALAESVLWDQHGRVGRAIQALLVSRK